MISWSVRVRLVKKAREVREQACRKEPEKIGKPIRDDAAVCVCAQCSLVCPYTTQEFIDKECNRG